MMAGIVLKKKDKKKQNDWGNTGSFINKPSRGWLHPDEQLAPDAGVCYGVRYIGCMEVKESMRTLDFDTRTAVAKESISRVCDAAGLKTATKKTKRGAKISKLIGDNPNMLYAGSNVNLTITTESLSLMIMETGEIISNHLMPGISFASGGDPDTMDFVSYVAKDEVNGRACFVLECGGGLAQDVITTVGQAFELRFKAYLQNKPQVTAIPERLEGAASNGDTWGEDIDYYNDRPGAKPPEPPQYDSKPSNLPVSDGNYSSVKEKKNPPVGDLIDLSSGTTYDNKKGAMGGETTYDNKQGAIGGAKGFSIYDNPKKSVDTFESPFDDNIYDNKGDSHRATGGAPTNGSLDAFDMQPFSSSLPSKRQSQRQDADTPFHEEWFHGKLTRPQAEALLPRDGDFLVRESPSANGQYVLSGNNGGKMKHLLLVDPEGVVRTIDRTFSSVSHLINYHMEQSLPITSHDSEVILKRPIIHSDI